MWKAVLLLCFACSSLFSAAAGIECPYGQKPGCGYNCQNNCRDYWGEPTFCVQVFCEVPTTCECDPSKGFYLDSQTGECKEGYLCPRPPKKTCPYGQRPGCGYNCGNNCRDYWGEPTFCAQVVCEVPNTCECDPSKGFYLDSTTGECKKGYLCPRPRRGGY